MVPGASLAVEQQHLKVKDDIIVKHTITMHIKTYCMCSVFLQLALSYVFS